MRSARRLGGYPPRTALVVLGLAATAACGTWSNEDIAFVEALPTSQTLRLSLPSSTSQALTTSGSACGAAGASEVWARTKPVSDGINAAVDRLLGFVDVVKSAPPTSRGADSRVWGPWADAKHSGIEVRVTMSRSRDASGVPTYAYVFEERSLGGTYLAVLDGSFRGESARAGSGTFALHFANLRTLGVDEHPDTDPYGDLTVQYDRTGDPTTLSLDVPTGSQGGALVDFNYGYAGYQSGSGRFDFVFVNDSAQRYEVATRFDATGAGLATVTVVLSATSRFSFQECWDSAGCITDVKDATTLFVANGISGLCPGGVCPTGACPSP
jgi:hypothetical protein